MPMASFPPTLARGSLPGAASDQAGPIGDDDVTGDGGSRVIIGAVAAIAVIIVVAALIAYKRRQRAASVGSYRAESRPFGAASPDLIGEVGGIARAAEPAPSFAGDGDVVPLSLRHKFSRPVVDNVMFAIPPPPRQDSDSTLC